MKLSTRVLNRTLLARQHLLERSSLTVHEMCEHLVGLQAQDSLPPFVGLFSRVAAFDPATVSEALEARSLVRITLMRGTIHLVTPPDAVRIAPHVQPELEKVPFRKGFNYGAMVGLDPEEVRGHGEATLGDEPMSAADLRARAAELYPDRDPGAVVQTWLYQLPVLQTPPRGKWKDNSRPVWSRVEPWLGTPLDPAYPLAELIFRYLRAFGPASTMDMQTWSKLLGMKQAVAELGDRVRAYTDERGRTLYDVADGELADPDVPAPVRLLGWYDNAVLSHRDRTRIVPDGAAPPLRAFAAQVSPVLVDGFLAGMYKVFTNASAARLRISPTRKWTAAERADVEAEAHALLGFLEGDKQGSVEILDVHADLRP
ncbi:winged helix DNA-binding domain-containing protein [Nocardia implantans]|uniref:Winged helix DNA-binding domain-containing protein n=1 Tax=Nocardia implantans TaxID=3108168 RepID=A0ABU6B5T0_9NOCA|nr:MULTISPECIES: winged helix DNA-binding domain-containing protein [unclassified Nocardia]MBF6196207.1 AlkZ family DNA glycosylase [Nocardia beijingensis]MEA3532847.1 winged helix DNA-binding domain-containing protein [Nocardia sp. CDC192]MEB3514719.1 winged helix DNA-binding domain-containing protein [Nocardia sp. CDC186]